MSLLIGAGQLGLSELADQATNAAASVANVMNNIGVFSPASLSELRSRPGLAGARVELLGYASSGDGGGGLFYWDASSTLPDDGVFVVQADGVATGRYRRIPSTITPRMFGGMGNRPAVENAAFIAAFQANFEKTLFVPKAVYKFDKGLVVNIAQLKLYGDRAMLDFTALRSGVALIITGAGGSDFYDNCVNTISSLRIKGPGKTTDTKGMVFDTTGGGSTSHLNVNQVSISGFGVNLEIRNEAYTQNFTQFNSYDSGIAVYIANNADNAGERIGFMQSTLFNSNLGIKGENANADVFFSVCSLDYNKKQVESYNTLMQFSGCHFEGENYAAPSITADGYGANLKFIGGRITARDMTIKPAAVVQCDNNASIHFMGTDIHNQPVTGGWFATGNSRKNVRIDAPTGYQVPNVPLHISPEENRFIDGFFGQPIIVDSWAVDGTGTRQNPLLLTSADGSTEVGLQQATSPVQPGIPRSLKFTKRYGSGSAGSLYVGVPINRKRAFAAMLTLLPAAGVTGTVFISFQIAAGFYTNAQGLPSYRRSQEVAVFSVPLNGITTWRQQDMADRWYTPEAWAEYAVISINGALMSAGDLHIGMAQVSCF